MFLDAALLTPEDYFLAVAAAVIVAGAIISSSVLSRYRSLTVQLAKSNELATDLWAAFDSRMKKQDERIVNLMAKVEIYGVKSEKGRNSFVVKEKHVDFGPSPAIARNIVSEGMSGRPVSISSDVERMILQKLTEGAKSSTEIKVIIGKSREHTARLMKSLFDDGYVIRSDRERPFVYEITDSGKRYLTDNPSTGT